MGKLIVHASTRAEAVAKLGRALDSLHIEGVPTTAPLHRTIVASAGFAAGGVDSTFLPYLDFGGLTA
jgi:acetyl-CoA carboxylase biotin carboxylase subunit